MRVELVPPAATAEHAVVRAALLAAGVRLEPTASAYGAAWRTAALAEAVERQADSAGYALSPRKTRGATRA